MHLVADQFEPYQIDDKTGLSIDIIKQVFKNTEYEISIEIVPWARALYMIEHKHADGIFSSLYNKDREKFAVYPKEALIASKWLYYSKKNNLIDFENLSQYSIGLVREYSYSFLNRMKFKSYQMSNSDLINLRKLTMDRMDLTCAEKMNASYLINMNDLTNKIQAHESPILSQENLYLIFRNDIDPNVIKTFDDNMVIFKQTKEYSDLIDRYKTYKK